MATNRRLVSSEGADFYVTPSRGTLSLLKYEIFSGKVLEPCCGDGAISKVLLDHGLDVSSSDIIDRGFGSVLDFLKSKECFDNIITNPPFNIAEEIFHHAYSLFNNKLCLLLRTAFLEGIGRYDRIYKKHPPARILLFSKRLSIYPAGVDREGGGTTSYSWFVWDCNQTEETKIIWIEP